MDEQIDDFINHMTSNVLLYCIGISAKMAARVANVLMYCIGISAKMAAQVANILLYCIGISAKMAARVAGLNFWGNYEKAY